MPLRCVMCGRDGTRVSAEASAELVLFIKNSGKYTTCEGCTHLTYRLRDTTDGYFKWCERCYKFKSLSAFAGKLNSVSCDCCRKKRRAHGKRKRKADADEADADAPTA